MKIQIYVLQSPQIFVDGRQIIMPYKKSEALLYYMAIEKKSTRDQAAALLWDTCDETTAKKNLRHALYTIHKIVKEEVIISPSRHRLELNPDIEIHTDYDDFMSREEISVYREELLCGFYVKNAYPYEEWLTLKRSQAKERYLKQMFVRMSENESLSLAEGESVFEQYIREDPLDERVYLCMMEMYNREHLYYKGIRLYQKLSALLNTELRVSPCREIKNLYRSMLEDWTEEGEKEEETETAIYGRREEIQKLKAAYHRFLAGVPTAAAISGETGVGKTCLAEYFLEGISGENCLILRTSCLETEQSITLQPWNAIMIQVNTYIKEYNIELSAKYLEAAEHLFPLFHISSIESAILGDTTISYTYRTARNLFQKLFAELGEKVPVILFFDNIQYMDETSLEFVSMFIREQNSNLMVLAVCPNLFMPVLKNYLLPLMKENLMERIFLQPFEKEEVRAILQKNMSENVTDEVLDSIYDATAGNALFLKTLLDCYADGKLKEGVVSPMQEVWARRIETLSGADRQVLELISACQSWADMDSLVTILKKDEMEILDSIEELERQDFIYERQEGDSIRFSFCHGSMQKFVHMQMSPSKVRVFHEKYASYIEKLPSYEASRNERLIYHYVQCGNREKTVEYKILALNDYSKKYYELYPLFFSRGDKEFQTGDNVLDFCSGLEEELFKLCQEKGQKPSYLNLHILLMQVKGQYCISQGHFGEGAQCIQKALRSNALAGNDPAVRLRCLRFLIYQQVNRWELNETKDLLKESLELAEKLEYEEDYAITLRLYGLYLTMRGDYEEALMYLQKSLDYFSDNPLQVRIYAPNIAACYNYMGEALRKQKLFEEAIELYRKAIEVCRKNGCSCNPTFFSNLGRSLWALNRREESKNAFYQADRLYEESYVMIGRSITKGYLSLLEAAAGNWEKAISYLKEAEEGAERFASPYAAGLLALTKAELVKMDSSVFAEALLQPEKEYRKEAASYLVPLPGAYELELFNREGG